MENRVLTTGEISKFCGVHLRTVIRWIERGHLKAYQLPGRGDNRVRVPDFLNFLRENHMPVPGELLASQRRVLIAEDDANMAATIQRVLRQAGFETQIASDGLRAGLLLETFKPAVMTLDLSMPGLSGFDVLRFIRETPSQAGTRILVISALPKVERQKALDLGADDTLAKPFDNHVLMEKVEALMEG